MPIDRVNTTTTSRQRHRSESGDAFHLVLDAANVGTWEWTLDTNEVRWSENLEAIHGLTPGTFDGTFEGFFRDVHPDDRQKVMDQIELAVKTGGEYGVEYRQNGNGSVERWIETRGKVIHDESGRPARMAGICMNITDRKRAEADTAHLAAIVTHSDDAIISKTLDGIITSFNPAAERMYGYRAEEVIGKPVSILMPHNHTDEYSSIMERIRRGKRVDHFETIRSRKDGSLFNASVTISPARDAEGKLIGASAIARDVTNRKRFEEQLRHSEERWRELVSAIPAGVYVCDADGRISEFNGRAAELWGRKPRPDDRICGSLRMWTPDGRPLPHEECPMASVLRTGEAVRDGEVVIERPDGSRITVLVSISPLRDAEGRVIGAVNCFQNITTRKHNENLLHQRLAQLRILYDLSNAVSQSSAIENVYNAALDGLEQALNADRAAILLYDQPSGDNAPLMHFVAWRGLSDEYRAAVEGHSPWTPDATSPKPIVIDDAEKHDLGELRQVVIDEGIRALGFFPLVHQGRLIGKFMVYFNKSRQLTEEEIRLGQTIADQIAYAIERRNSEAALHRREQEFRTLAEHSPDVIVRFDRDHRHLYISPAIEAATGLSPEQFIGRTKEEVGMDAVHCDRWEQCRRACFESGEPQEMEFEYPSPNGVRYFNTRVMPEFGVDGQVETVLAVSRDITERKKAEHALSQSERNLADFFDNATLGLHWVNAEGVIIRANRAELEMLGYEEHEYVGRHIAEFHVDQPVNDEILARLARGETVSDFPARLRHKDGSIRHAIINSSALFEDGRFVHTRCFTRDVTEQQNSEEELARQFAQLDAIYASAPVGLAFADTELRFVRVNEAMARFNGRTVEEHIGRTGCEVVGEQMAPVEEVLRKVITTGKPITDIELRIAMPSQPGVERDWLASYHPVHDASGKCIGVNAIVQDITMRKRSEVALAASEARARARAEELEALMESNPAAVFHAHDCDCRLITGNQAAYDMLCRPRGANLSKTAPENEKPTNFEIFHNGTPCQESELPVQRAARGEVISGDELELRFGDGRVIQIVCNAVPCFDDQGNPRGAIATFVDITEQKEAERQVRLMNATLEERVKERTSQLRMLARRLTQAEQQERRRLARILHDDLQQLLVASAMRAEQLAQRHDGLDVSAAAKQVHDLIQQSIQSARSLTSEICPPVLYDGGLAATLPWLVRRIEQRHDLAVNLEIDESAEPSDEETRIALYLTARELLFNVAKYAKTNEAFVSLSRRDNEWVRLVVEDRGVGFDTSQIERSEDGGGFGLFSLRERAELFGGRMAIHSEIGKGTRIEFELPLRPARPQQVTLPFTQAVTPPPSIEVGQQHAGNGLPTTDHHQDHRTRVILVDDHQIVREGIAGILAEQSDIEVIAEAVDGRQAVELARECRPEVVIMDITMPEMNGIEATRRITRHSNGVVVIGLSMHDSPDMARAMKDAGAARVLVKDGPAEALVEAIREVASRTAVNEN
jgi:PAS domain S-box-containing protein